MARKIGIVIVGYTILITIGAVVFKDYSRSNSSPPEVLMLFGPILGFYEYGSKITPLAIGSNALVAVILCIAIARKSPIIGGLFLLLWVMCGYAFFSMISI